MKDYALIGRKLGHSYSAEFFNRKFRDENIDARYSLIELPDLSNLHDIISHNPNLTGFNVTIPYKEEILQYLDFLSPLAMKTGAVNCVKIIKDKTARKGYLLKGHNTDVEGFSTAIHPLLEARSGKALILGSGGASKAVATALSELGWDYRIVSRNSGNSMIPYNKLTPEQVWETDVIINTTPCGMYPNVNSVPDFPFQYMRNGNEGKKARQLAFDLVYNPSETLFMKICQAHGAIISNGLIMLYSQAEGAWRFWNAD